MRFREPDGEMPGVDFRIILTKFFDYPDPTENWVGETQERKSRSNPRPAGIDANEPHSVCVYKIRPFQR